jgi:hypothetical protein
MLSPRNRSQLPPNALATFGRAFAVSDPSASLSNVHRHADSQSVEVRFAVNVKGSTPNSCASSTGVEEGPGSDSQVCENDCARWVDASKSNQISLIRAMIPASTSI